MFAGSLLLASKAVWSIRAGKVGFYGTSFDRQSSPAEFRFVVAADAILAFVSLIIGVVLLAIR
jgi:hypothetical protein